MNYPIKFNKCPACGSTNRIAEIETQSEIEKGNLPQNARIPMMASQARLFDPQDNRILLARREIPVLMCFIDVCADCGCVCAVEVHKAKGVIESRVGQPKGNLPMEEIPPFFGKG